MATDKTAPEAPKKTKREKFVDLANTRTAKAMSAIAVIGGLASKTNYDYTDGDVTAITTALRAEIDVLEKRFANPKAVAKVGSIIAA